MGSYKNAQPAVAQKPPFDESSAFEAKNEVGKSEFAVVVNEVEAVVTEAEAVVRYEQEECLCGARRR